MKFNIFIQKGCPKKGDLTSTLILMYWANGLFSSQGQDKRDCCSLKLHNTFSQSPKQCVVCTTVTVVLYFLSGVTHQHMDTQPSWPSPWALSHTRPEENWQLMVFIEFVRWHLKLVACCDLHWCNCFWLCRRFWGNLPWPCHLSLSPSDWWVYTFVFFWQFARTKTLIYVYFLFIKTSCTLVKSGASKQTSLSLKTYVCVSDFWLMVAQIF